MAEAHYPIQALAEMIDAFDREEPKSGRATTAFIKRWRAKELEEKHKSQHHLQIAIRDINPVEIQNIRATKHFRDEQKERGKQGNFHSGKKGGKASAEARASSKVVVRPVRNVIW